MANNERDYDVSELEQQTLDRIRRNQLSEEVTRSLLDKADINVSRSRRLLAKASAEALHVSQRRRR